MTLYFNKNVLIATKRWADEQNIWFILRHKKYLTNYQSKALCQITIFRRHFSRAFAQNKKGKGSRRVILSMFISVLQWNQLSWDLNPKLLTLLQGDKIRSKVLLCFFFHFCSKCSFVTQSTQPSYWTCKHFNIWHIRIHII